MIPDGATPRRRALAWILSLLSVVATALTLWALATGGFRTHVFGIPLSVRGAFRPALIAVVCAVGALHLLDAWRWPVWSRAAARMGPVPALVATAAALGVLVTGVLYGTRAAGGSDVYGYVSQATLWLKGTLVLRQDFIATMPWPNAAWSFSPLGYRPADFEHTIMPTYAPGTALLMALLQLVVGACGPYLVGPLCGAALVALTYRLGVHAADRVIGMIGACAVATSPAVLFMTNWPMSDVPAATFWTAALVAAARPGLTRAIGAGAATGIAILIRPNLAPLAIVPAFMLLGAHHGSSRRGLRDALLFSLATVPFVAFTAWLFNHLYGSPLRSGYGDLSDLYAWANAPKNLALYTGWFYETQGPLAFACIASPLFLLRRPWAETRVRWCLLTFAALLVAMYLVYTPFDFWTYLRFLLPAFPVAFILAADAVREATRALGAPARAVTLLLFGVATVGFGLNQSDGRNVLGVGESEQKFADVGQFAGTLPPNAVVYAQQHGGNVRFYGNRLTLRFDILDPEWLDRSLEHLRGAGFTPYILLEKWELPQFKERFANQRAVALLDRQPIAVTLDGVVRLYATEEGNAGGPVVIPKTAGCVAPHPAFGSPR